MGLREEVDKSLEETRNNLKRFEKLSEQVEFIRRQNESFEREFGFSIEQAAESVGRLHLTEDEKRKYEEEKKAFEEELARDLAASEEKFRKEMARGDATSKPAIRKRTRQMI